MSKCQIMTLRTSSSCDFMGTRVLVQEGWPGWDAFLQADDFLDARHRRTTSIVDSQCFNPASGTQYGILSVWFAYHFLRWHNQLSELGSGQGLLGASVTKTRQNITRLRTIQKWSGKTRDGSPEYVVSGCLFSLCPPTC